MLSNRLAVTPPGLAREDWKIIRALSEVRELVHCTKWWGDVHARGAHILFLTSNVVGWQLIGFLIFLASKASRVCHFNGHAFTVFTGFRLHSALR